MTPEKIAELRRLAEAATPGPWELGPLHKTSEGKTWLTFDEQREIFPPLEKRPHHAQYGGPIAVTSEGECANGEYLAACDPQTVQALCDLAARALAVEAERDRLAAENAQLRSDLDAAIDTNAHADLVRLLASNPGEAATGLVQQLTLELDASRRAHEIADECRNEQVRQREQLWDVASKMLQEEKAQRDRLATENAKLREYQEIATSQVERARLTAGNAQEEMNRNRRRELAVQELFKAILKTMANGCVPQMIWDAYLEASK